MSTDTSLQELSSRSGTPFARIARERVRGIRLRPGMVWTAVWIAMGGTAVYLLAPQLGELRQSLRALRSVQPAWLAVGAGLLSLRYALAALTIRAAVGGTLALVPTTFVQVSSSFVGRLTPEGIGWLVLNQRYLERSGLERSSAVTAITLKVAAGAVMRLLVMALVAVLVGTSGIFDFELPFSWPYLIAIPVGLLLLGLIARRVLGPRASRVIAPVAAGLKELVRVFRQPARAATLFGASAGVTLSYPLVLMVSLTALGAEFSFLEVFAVYLGGTAVASTSPTPGNLGAVEAALAAGLITVGIAPGPATAAVLLYRLLTFWLPILPGFVAFRYLQQKGHL